MKTGRPEDVLDWLKPGRKVFIQGGPGECTALIDLLKANPGAARGVELWTCLVPGVNTFDYGSLADGPSLVTFMASPALAPSIATGRTRIDAIPYSKIAQRLLAIRFDLAIFHCSAPMADGWCSFSLSSETGNLVAKSASRRFAFLNQRMPPLANADGIGVDDLDLAIAVDAPLLSPGLPKLPAAGQNTAVLQAIAHNASGFVADGATLQSGVGAAPRAVIAALKDRRNLAIHTGIITPEYRDLSEAGALSRTAIHTAGIAWGEVDFYDWLRRTGFIRFRSIPITHGEDVVRRLPKFTSVGSAIEVDLSGAINLERVGARVVSSVGGARDYIEGAFNSKGGRSIIALPSTAGSGASRIVGRVSWLTIAAPPANADFVVVTEHGAAELRGLSALQRAHALMAIAAPEHRDALAASLGR